MEDVAADTLDLNSIKACFTSPRCRISYRFLNHKDLFRE